MARANNITLYITSSSSLMRFALLSVISKPRLSVYFYSFAVCGLYTTIRIPLPVQRARQNRVASEFQQLYYVVDSTVVIVVTNTKNVAIRYVDFAQVTIRLYVGRLFPSTLNSFCFFFPHFPHFTYDTSALQP